MGKLIEGTWTADGHDTTKHGGRFERPETSFRNWVTPDGSAGPTGKGGFEARSGRYHLYVSHACPWAHRTLIFRKLKGLEDHITVSVVHPDMLDDGWTFDTDDHGATGDTLLSLDFLRDVYIRANPIYTGSVTVPVLWDKDAKHHRLERKRRDHPDVQFRLRRSYRQYQRLLARRLA